MNFNKVMIAGYLVRDPELTYTSNQTAVVNFDVATNYKRGDREETCFVNCVAFGNMAETIVKFLTKGKPIFVVGRLTQDRWEANDGSKRSRIKITVEEFKFVGTSGNQGNIQQENKQFNIQNDW